MEAAAAVTRRALDQLAEAVLATSTTILQNSAAILLEVIMPLHLEETMELAIDRLGIMVEYIMEPEAKITGQLVRASIQATQLVVIQRE